MEFSGSDLKTGLNTLVDERVSGLLTKLEQSHPQYHALCCRIREQKNELKSNFDEQGWGKVENFLLSLTQQADVEKQYLFAQGITDCATAVIYLKGEVIDREFQE